MALLSEQKYANCKYIAELLPCHNGPHCICLIFNKMTGNIYIIGLVKPVKKWVIGIFAI